MRKNNTRRLLNKNDSDATFELDLAPMLALMVTLIPIMLLATSFVKVRVINTVLPQAVKEAIQNDKNKLSKVISIDLEMNEGNFTIIVKEDEKEISRKVIPNKGKDWDYKSLHTELFQVKKLYPKKYSLNIFPHENIPYDKIVMAIDEAREAKKGEEAFLVFDKTSNKQIKTRVMFPEVSFSGLIGG